MKNENLFERTDCHCAARSSSAGEEEEVALFVTILVPALGFAFVVGSVSFVVCYWLNMTARYRGIKTGHTWLHPVCFIRVGF